jgi:hypothetical protein
VRVVSGGAGGGDSGPVAVESASVGELGPLATDDERAAARSLNAAHVRSGAVRVRSGQGGAGSGSGSGNVTLASGSASAAGGASGGVTVRAGDSAGGRGGGVSVQAGASGGGGEPSAAGGSGDGQGGVGGRVSVRSGGGAWGSGSVWVGSADATAAWASGGGGDATSAARAASGRVEMATGDAEGQAGPLLLRTGATGGSEVAGEPSSNGIALRVGHTRGASKGGPLALRAGSSELGVGGDVDVRGKAPRRAQ